MRTIQIDERFRGPSNSGNGGYSAGLAASFIDGPAEVTLRKPPPLATPIAVQDADDIIRLSHDGETIIEARSARPENPPVPFVPIEQARAAITPPVGHAFPECFVCGPDRAQGDGLRLFVGPVEGTDIYAATWTPDDSLTGTEHVPNEMMWAALDCPSAWPSLYSGATSVPIVLGRLTASVSARPRIGEEAVVVARLTKVDGRKHHASSAIYSADGALLAHADAVWIELRA